MTSQDEFKEIGHSGGKVTITVIDDNGRTRYSFRWTHQRPTTGGITAVYAIPQGVAVGPLHLGGIGQPWNAAPLPGCLPVLIGSDSEGFYGHQCPDCGGYWRSQGGSSVCAYCGLEAPRHNFLTEAQQAYVFEYCQFFSAALSCPPGEHTIDMDAVAEAAGTDIEKPAFYYSEQAQQRLFECSACGSENDIIGRVAYCSICATRNDLELFEVETLPKIRDLINSSDDHGRRVTETIGAFDTFVRQFARQLTQRIPMRTRRRDRLQKMSFHTLSTSADELKASCDIDILVGINPNDIKFASMMFHRRHVYEHQGGVVDEKYIRDSGDVTVRLNQEIRESKSDAHRLVGIISRMARNVHEGFHDIFPPKPEPIKRFAPRAR